MDFDDLRRKFGAIIGESVPAGGLEHMLAGDSSGRFQQKQMIKAIVALYTYLEAQAATPPTKAPIDYSQPPEPINVGHNTQTISASETVQPIK